MNPSIRWLSFVILLLALLVTQMAMGRLMGIGPQRIMPDLLLLLAIFLALRSSCTRTILACWVLGLVKDLSSSSVLGSYAISFSLVAFLILSLREWLYAGNPLRVADHVGGIPYKTMPVGEKNKMAHIKDDLTNEHSLTEVVSTVRDEKIDFYLVWTKLQVDHTEV